MNALTKQRRESYQLNINNHMAIPYAMTEENTVCSVHYSRLVNRGWLKTKACRTLLLLGLKALINSFAVKHFYIFQL